jgi:hypothetical protein
MLFLEFMLKISNKNFKNKFFMKEIKEKFENI